MSPYREPAEHEPLTPSRAFAHGAAGSLIGTMLALTFYNACVPHPLPVERCRDTVFVVER